MQVCIKPLYIKMMNNSVYINQQKLMHALWHERKIKQQASQGKTFSDWRLELARTTTMKPSLHWQVKLIHNTEDMAQTTSASGEVSKAWKNRIVANIWKDWRMLIAFCWRANSVESMALQGAPANCYPLPWSAGSMTGTARKRSRQEGIQGQSIEDREWETCGYPAKAHFLKNTWFSNITPKLPGHSSINPSVQCVKHLHNVVRREKM